MSPHWLSQSLLPPLSTAPTKDRNAQSVLLLSAHPMTAQPVRNVHPMNALPVRNVQLMSVAAVPNTRDLPTSVPKSSVLNTSALSIRDPPVPKLSSHTSAPSPSSTNAQAVPNQSLMSAPSPSGTSAQAVPNTSPHLTSAPRSPAPMPPYVEDTLELLPTEVTTHPFTLRIFLLSRTLLTTPNGLATRTSPVIASPPMSSTTLRTFGLLPS